MSYQIPARMQKHCRQSAMRKAFLVLELAETEGSCVLSSCTFTLIFALIAFGYCLRQ